MTGCGWMKPKEVIVTRTVVQQPTIPIKQPPRPVELHEVRWYAVTRENLDEFLEEFSKVNGNVVFFAVSVPHYENMSLNLDEIRRYVEQQQSLLLYYETEISEKASGINKETKETPKGNE